MPQLPPDNLTPSGFSNPILTPTQTKSEFAYSNAGDPQPASGGWLNFTNNGEGATPSVSLTKPGDDVITALGGKPPATSPTATAPAAAAPSTTNASTSPVQNRINGPGSSIPTLGGQTAPKPFTSAVDDQLTGTTKTRAQRWYGSKG